MKKTKRKYAVDSYINMANTVYDAYVDFDPTDNWYNYAASKGPAPKPEPSMWDKFTGAISDAGKSIANKYNENVTKPINQFKHGYNTPDRDFKLDYATDPWALKANMAMRNSAPNPEQMGRRLAEKKAYLGDVYDFAKRQSGKVYNAAKNDLNNKIESFKHGYNNPQYGVGEYADDPIARSVAENIAKQNEAFGYGQKAGNMMNNIKGKYEAAGNYIDDLKAAGKQKLDDMKILASVGYNNPNASLPDSSITKGAQMARNLKDYDYAGALKNAWNTTSETANKAAESTGNFFGDIGSSIGNKIEGAKALYNIGYNNPDATLPGSVMSSLGQTARNLSDRDYKKDLEFLSDDISQGASNAWNKVKEYGGDLVDSATNAWNSASPTTQNLLKYGGLGLLGAGLGYGAYKMFGGGKNSPARATKPKPVARMGGARPMGAVNYNGKPKGWITTRTGKKVPVYK